MGGIKRGEQGMKAVPIAIVVAVLAASPAAAEAEDAAAQAVAQCVADNDAEGVAALLGTVPGSRPEAKAAKPLLELFGPCENADRSAGGVIEWRERAELAYASARNRLAQGRPAQLAATWAPLSTTGMSADQFDARSQGILTFGACVTRAVPAAAVGLVGSAPGSQEERAAVRAIKPVVGGCAHQGEVYRLEVQNLRLILAEPVYHLLAGTR